MSPQRWLAAQEARTAQPDSRAENWPTPCSEFSLLPASSASLLCRVRGMRCEVRLATVPKGSAAPPPPPALSSTTALDGGL